MIPRESIYYVLNIFSVSMLLFYIVKNRKRTQGTCGWMVVLNICICLAWLVSQTVFLSDILFDTLTGDQFVWFVSNVQRPITTFTLAAMLASRIIARTK